MSLLDDVSIVVTPNGYKAGKLYAVIPSNGTADMDVTRATAATRVDENGLVNYAELIGGENLDISSGSPVFPSDWSSATANSVNFLGSSSAVSYYEDVATGMILGKTYRLELTISGYSGTGTTGFSNQGGTGSLGGVYSLNTDGIISILFISDGLNLRMFSRSTVTNVVFSNVSVKEVIRDNVPRIDYTGGGCPHILAEPQRTNIVFPSDIAVTQTRTVTAVAYALSFYGTGSIVLSGTQSSTLTGTGDNDRVDLVFTPTAGSLVLTISGTVTNFQLEAGSYATSLIPTVSGQVTRNQDQFIRDGISSLINSAEGVLFAEIAALSKDDTNRSICLSNGSSTDRILFRYEGSDTLRGFVISSGVIQVNFTFTHNNINNLKFAIKWKVNDFALWINGTEVLTDSSGISPTGLDRLALDNGFALEDFFGKVKQLQVYTTALSDTQLAALTS
tara:strand:+ start:1631 stop:2974 length:1344 start_codon:yes stop_codon:yes gene_type:complete